MSSQSYDEATKNLPESAVSFLHLDNPLPTQAGLKTVKLKKFHPCHLKRHDTTNFNSTLLRSMWREPKRAREWETEFTFETDSDKTFATNDLKSSY